MDRFLSGACGLLEAETLAKSFGEYRGYVLTVALSSRFEDVRSRLSPRPCVCFDSCFLYTESVLTYKCNRVCRRYQVPGSVCSWRHSIDRPSSQYNMALPPPIQAAGPADRPSCSSYNMLLSYCSVVDLFCSPVAQSSWGSCVCGACPAQSVGCRWPTVLACST